jgi:hypothetical protein
VEKTGRIRTNFNGLNYSATWRVVGAVVEVTSTLRSANAKLGGLATAPATVAVEKLREMAREASKPAKVAVDRKRFNINDA